MHIRREEECKTRYRERGEERRRVAGLVEGVRGRGEKRLMIGEGMEDVSELREAKLR
jgi:soluble P-type ATPase